jgi:hypothetical protein
VAVCVIRGVDMSPVRMLALPAISGVKSRIAVNQVRINSGSILASE